jgi:hypothetical protein
MEVLITVRKAAWGQGDLTKLSFHRAENRFTDLIQSSGCLKSTQECWTSKTNKWQANWIICINSSEETSLGQGQVKQCWKWLSSVCGNQRDVPCRNDSSQDVQSEHILVSSNTTQPNCTWYSERNTKTYGQKKRIEKDLRRYSKFAWLSSKDKMIFVLMPP